MAKHKNDLFFFKMDSQILKDIQKEVEKRGLKHEDNIENILDVIEEVAWNVALEMFNDLKRKAPKMLKEQRKIRTSFEKRLDKLWKEPLDLLEAFLVLSIEIGDTISKELRLMVTDKNFVFVDVLTRLHGLACLIGGEILSLLRSGYADGANARWRSLHEVVVIASFIRKNGIEVAKRYIQHNNIESYKVLLKYRKYSKKLNLIPISDKELGGIKKERDKLIKKYGKSFKNPYGWATIAFKNNKNPKLSDLEKAVDLDHLRPYYQMASHHVHSNPKSILFKLGLLYYDESVILAGPSNAGLADPGQGMVISLNQINCVLLSLRLSIMGIVTTKMMVMWLKELRDKFLEVHKIVENRWRKES